MEYAFEEIEVEYIPEFECRDEDWYCDFDELHLEDKLEMLLKDER